MDEKALRNLYSENTAVKEILSFVGADTDGMREITVDEIHAHFVRVQKDIDRWSIVQALKKLAEHGWGKFTPGRRTHKSRIHWYCDPSSILEKASSRAPTAGAGAVGVSKGDEISKPLPMRRHVYPIRFGLTATVEVPMDITKEEAAALAAFVAGLSFTRI